LARLGLGLGGVLAHGAETRPPILNVVVMPPILNVVVPELGAYGLLQPFKCLTYCGMVRIKN
jgi:hypothetical protein